MASQQKRHRFWYALLLVIIFGVGIFSRSGKGILHPFIVAYAGDTLWALFVFVGTGFLLSASATLQVAAISVGISLVIELSQLYHAPWIDTIRHTSPGALMLGHGFLWSDAVCYLTGITTGVCAEYVAAYIPRHRERY